MDITETLQQQVAKVVRAENFSRETLEAMRYRCDEQGHDFENCCSVLFQVYQVCRWCGQRR